MRIIDDLVDDSAPMNVKSSLEELIPEESGLEHAGQTDHLRYDSGASPGKGRKTMFTSIVRLYQAWRQYETVRRELSQLTDRDLADIGITRSDIERIASREARS
jgi:uncharacterized protein YjiS (DUF1127 family)